MSTFLDKFIIGTTEIIINGKGNYKNEVTLNCNITNFKKVSGWDDTNGAVRSLINVNGTLYVGTIVPFNKGNLYISEKI